MYILLRRRSYVIISVTYAIFSLKDCGLGEKNVTLCPILAI